MGHLHSIHEGTDSTFHLLPNVDAQMNVAGVGDWGRATAYVRSVEKQARSYCHVTCVGISNTEGAWG
jgi:hypothetical protein